MAINIHLTLLKSHNGKMSKELGDGFLICFASVIDAVHFVKDLIQEVSNEEQFLPES